MANISALNEKDNFVQHLEQLRADFAALSDTVAKLATEGANSAKSQVSDAAAKAVYGATAARQQVYRDAATIGHDAVKTAAAASGQIESQIMRNPVAAVLGALAAGFAIGLLSRRQ